MGHLCLSVCVCLSLSYGALVRVPRHNQCSGHRKACMSCLPIIQLLARLSNKHGRSKELGSRAGPATDSIRNSPETF